MCYSCIRVFLNHRSAAIRRITPNPFQLGCMIVDFFLFEVFLSRYITHSDTVPHTSIHDGLLPRNIFILPLAFITMRIIPRSTHTLTCSTSTAYHSAHTPDCFNYAYLIKWEVVVCLIGAVVSQLSPAQPLSQVVIG